MSGARLLRHGVPVALAALAVVATAWPRAGAGQSVRTRRGDVVWLQGEWFRQGSKAVEVHRAVRLCRFNRTDVVPGGCRKSLFEDESPMHRVWVAPYGIDRTEVTRRQWRRCVAAGECVPSRLPDDDDRVSRPGHPVAGVTWSEARAYCEFAGGRLPTESEWERAARGRTQRRFPWGDAYNDRLANHGLSGQRRDGTDGHRYAASVGSYPDAASPHGLLDAAGNVWEWTADAYDAEAYQGKPRIDPHVTQAGGKRVVRGGSWRSPAHTLRVTHREPRPPSGAWPDVGLRCAYDP